MKFLPVISALCLSVPFTAEAWIQPHRSFSAATARSFPVRGAKLARGGLTMRKGRPSTKLPKKKSDGPGKQIDWVEVASSADDIPQGDGDTKAVTARSETLVLIKQGEKIYGVAASCTTCKFPMLSAKIREGGDDGPNVACGLCGTLYQLDNGKVAGKEEIGGISGAFGNLMSKNTATDIATYEVRTAPSGKTYVSFGLKDDN